jgi:hypothetical protein
MTAPLVVVTFLQSQSLSFECVVDLTQDFEACGNEK